MIIRCNRCTWEWDSEPRNDLNIAQELLIIHYTHEHGRTPTHDDKARCIIPPTEQLILDLVFATLIVAACLYALTGVIDSL